jgi:hypothetical protein
LVTHAAQADFSKLIEYVPETANALILVDADSVFYSPIATREKWQERREEQFSEGFSGIPPNARKLIIEADLDPESMRPSWEVAVAQPKAVATLERIAIKFGGELDTVNSVPAARLQDDSFLVQFPNGMLGMMAPGNRQDVARWIDRQNRNLSPYLQRAVKYVEGTAQVIMAIDLQHAFDAAGVQRGLEEMDSVKQIDKAKLAKLLESIHGVTLGLTFDEKASGKLIVDFGQEATLISDVAKPFLLEVLGLYGVSLNEMTDWKAMVKGKQLILAGPISEDGLSRVGTLIHLPTTALHKDRDGSDDDGAGQTVSSGESTVLESTKKYHKSVESILKRLKLKKSNMQTMGQVAHWFQSYAGYIDRLPTLNVDDEMLQFGNYISGQLRDASLMLKGVNIQKRVDTVAAADSAQIYGGVMSQVGGYNANPNAGGYYGSAAYGAYGRVRSTNFAYGLLRHGGIQGAIRSELRQQQVARTSVAVQAKAKQASSIQDVVSNIETAVAQIRQSMTQKYQVQF